MHADGYSCPVRLRSMVGLIPLIAVEVLDADAIDKLPHFKKRMKWFLHERKDLARHVSFLEQGRERRILLALASRTRLERVLRRMLDEAEFLSPYGVRSLSKAYAATPYVLKIWDAEQQVRYVPGESDTGLFGGNSNWRGPVWFPANYLLIEALERFHHFHGPSFRVECPTGSGNWATLAEVAQELSRRLTLPFLPGPDGRRPSHGGAPRWEDPHWRDLVLFYEHFHGDDGRGLGATHQTGWTSLVVRCLESCVACDLDTAPRKTQEEGELAAEPSQRSPS